MRAHDSLGREEGERKGEREDRKDNFFFLKTSQLQVSDNYMSIIVYTYTYTLVCFNQPVFTWANSTGFLYLQRNKDSNTPSFKICFSSRADLEKKSKEAHLNHKGSCTGWVSLRDSD